MPAAFFALMLLSPGKATARDRIEAVAVEYGIKIEVTGRQWEETRPGYTVSAEPVKDADLDRYVDTFEREWRRYPKSLMARVHLRKIMIASNVKVLGQPRAAVPDFSAGWYWLDAKVGQRIPRYGKHVLHHDFFHMIDEYDSPDRLADAGWMALNPATVKYGEGGGVMRTGNVSALRDDLPGFLTEYATSAVEEDKAEVYGHLLSNPAFVRKRVAADPVLAAKVARIRELVKAFEPAMDEAWWVRNSAE